MPIRVFVYSHKAYNEYRLENNKQGESIVKIEREKFQISRNVNREYNRSGKEDVLEFFNDMEEKNLSEFVENRVKH